MVAEELAPEPAPDSNSKNNNNNNNKPLVASLRFSLPDGQRFARRFAPDTTLRQLRAFVIVELAARDSRIRRFNLFHNTKRRVIVSAADDGNAPAAAAAAGDDGGSSSSSGAGGGSGSGGAGADPATTTTLLDVGLCTQPDVLLVQDLDA